MEGVDLRYKGVGGRLAGCFEKGNSPIAGVGVIRRAKAVLRFCRSNFAVKLPGIPIPKARHRYSLLTHEYVYDWQPLIHEQFVQEQLVHQPLHQCSYRSTVRTVCITVSKANAPSMVPAKEIQQLRGLGVCGRGWGKKFVFPSIITVNTKLPKKEK